MSDRPKDEEPIALPPPKEETGLVLYGEVELDLWTQYLDRYRCTYCGAPAVKAVRKLGEQGRVFLCAAHAEVKR